MNSRIQSLIGLARRAGKVASGEAQVEALLKKRLGYLLILAEDAPGAQKKYDHWAKDLKLQVVVTGTKEELGHCIGLSPRSAVLILDQGFAKAILLARS
ncbi:ribosomal L7Ae/L30e/S12e/Gadd45 family protein [Desulfosporosinus sp. PR]|uniref:L7Ae/L30e/S12e/Gadd45 family ribosomal protein n=1 Tax=Candidatus Desulfosporosinus nitrosoreducens TaxID=3401928 RepID=UPI0027FBB83C|nr:ribosomal L7Ae/L30e/S12e/Gadd45 family protein [Desulfosporosinus sp. PR]MDQ7093377.1 ribosomal L7Ae/L30e/S12e/Gadd45 family protein [Desulfosporosinus sp. PR]